jgi:hypothetical protein
MSLQYRQATRRLHRLAVLGLVNVAIVGGIVWQVVTFNRPKPQCLPAFATYWAEVARRGELKIGDTAPEFSLRTWDGQREVRLSELRGHKAVVLLFGSYTCPSFRSHTAPIKEAYAKYRDKAAFFLIYLREAHPEEDGHIPENAHLEPIPSPKVFEERAQAARTCAAALDLQMPILVDDLDGRAEHDYRAWPERLFVIDRHRKIAYTGAAAGDVNVSQFMVSLETLANEDGRSVDEG